MYYIYEITNKVNGNTYIGQRKCPPTKTPETDPYMGSGSLLHKAYKKYGMDCFYKTIIADDLETKEEIDQAEKLCILISRAFGKAEYNIAAGGIGGGFPKGTHFSDEHKKRISQSRKGQSVPEEAKTKISQANKGHRYSPKTEFQKGRTPWNKGLSYKGTPRSESTKNKISQALKGKPKSDFVKEAVSKANSKELILQLSLDGEVLHEYPNAESAMKATGVFSTNIRSCCKNKPGYKTAGGYKWQFKNQ